MGNNGNIGTIHNLAVVSMLVNVPRRFVFPAVTTRSELLHNVSHVLDF